jgi:hypothetical protein
MVPILLVMVPLHLTRHGCSVFISAVFGICKEADTHTTNVKAQ